MSGRVRRSPPVRRPRVGHPVACRVRLGQSPRPSTKHDFETIIRIASSSGQTTYMATQLQYEVFKSAYDEESQRHTDLESRAKLFLTIITAYLGAVAFKTTDVLVFLTKFRISFSWYLLLGACLVVALLFTVFAMGIRTYEGVFDPEVEIRSYRGKPKPLTDDEFLDRRIADLAVATNRNTRVNNKIANTLRWAGILILLGITVQLAIFILAIRHYPSAIQ